MSEDICSQCGKKFASSDLDGRGRNPVCPDCKPTFMREEIFGINIPSPKTKETLFGRYKVIGEIARGGMGVVYKVLHSELNRIVARQFHKTR